MATSTDWTLNKIDHELLDLALREDLGLPYSDVTTSTLFQTSIKDYSVKIISKEKNDIVICGIPIVNALLKKLTANFKLQTYYQDGDALPSGKKLLTIKSDPKTLLMLERTILNFLRHLSAVSTLTKKFTDLVKDTNLKILDTRKTTPGWRHLEKYAVLCGGGVNHRMGLYDAFMIKDTHIDLIGSMQTALEHLPSLNENPLPVIVEVRNESELETVIKYGKNKVNRVLLDNMAIDSLRKCVKMCRGIFETEASGNINLQTIVDIAQTGVDYAAIGMLTYAAGHVDLSMKKN
jgi:nicotinate-nucleotide pyrophosphorylase (carboxylating)